MATCRPRLNTPTEIDPRVKRATGRIPKTATMLAGACLCWGILQAILTAGDAALKDDESSDVHWSFRRLPELNQHLAELTSSGDQTELQPIDAYITRSLRSHGLSPGKRAAPHRQVRRLSLMLTGLPPNPDIVREYVEDPTDVRYAQLVDYYLNSPHFGERWARHWMDVVRFAETWGYEWNHLIREAWRYRDYLIRAFNQDIPYDQLIREHIAGDLLANPRINSTLGINESLIGTAFYRFGETGHDDCVLYPDISLDVMDNQIDTLSKAFQALTVSCSRCHDHKLDDIPQRDYYGLLGVMASSRQVIRTLDLPNRQDELKGKLTALKHSIREELAQIWLSETERISTERIQQLCTQSGENLDNIEHPLFTWHKMTKLPSETLWQKQWDETREALKSEHDRRVEFNRNNYVPLGDFSPESNELTNWGFEGLAFENDKCCTPPGDFCVQPDGTQVISDVFRAGFYSHGLSQKLNAVIRSPLLPEDKKFVSYRAMGERHSVCRTVMANCTLPYFHTNRFASSKLSWATVNLEHIRKSPLVQLKSYLEWATALDDQGFPVLDMPQSEYQSVLDNPRSYFGVTDVVVHDVGHPPLEELPAQLQLFEYSVSSPDELARRYREICKSAVTRWSVGRSVDSDVFWLNSCIDLGLLSRDQSASDHLNDLVVEYRDLEERFDTPKRIVGMSDQDNGFDVPLLEGGDPQAPQELVHRGFLEAIETQISDNLPQGGSGRLRLANLIAHPRNPLTSRVMANRVWHYLFGRGIVRSVDDFGNMGDRPTHPELLDYLARRLIDSGWSTKSLIREIVLSDTFRQSSANSAQGMEKDPENDLFYRYMSRRLEAEIIRDSLLSVSGRLDPTMFGPSVNPHRPEDVDRRKLCAGPLDGNGRRSLYLKVTRMGPSRLLELFNFPDPSMTRGRRDRTNVPAQALGLLNHPLVHQQADVHAERLLKETTSTMDFELTLENLFLRLFSRTPSDIESKEYAHFFDELAAEHGISFRDEALKSTVVWKDLIHLLYNLKEFTYVL